LTIPCWQPCSVCLVQLALFWLSRSGCPSSFFLSCPGYFYLSSPVLAVLSCCSVSLFLPVLFSCPVPGVLSFMSSPGCPALAVLSWHPVLPVLFCQSCFACPVLLLSSACPVLPALVCLSGSACPVLLVLWLSFLPVISILSRAGSLVLIVLSWQSFPGSLFLTVLFCLSCCACPVLHV
jgi:hypothetical protein